jgi:DNA-binding MarR family transcriptional regulator
LKDEQAAGLFFRVFNEIGIIEQLGRTIFEARLPDGMTVPHFSVLNHLIRVQDGQTPLRIARAFQVPKTSMTNTLSGLEKRGFVEMRQNPDDGRSKRVWLTDAGRAARDAGIAALGQDFVTLARDFDVQKLVAIAPVLQDLREFLDANRLAD